MSREISPEAALLPRGSERVVRAVPLSPEVYAHYGNVIMASPPGATGKPANQGTARRYDHLAELEDRRPGRARPNVAVFRCSPRRELPVEVALLEKHPASTQLFVPMNAARYLVVVALGNDRPDLGTLAAFVASGRQGVTYRPGVWHHPLLALDAETDFACLVWEDDTEGDCVVVDYPPGERAVVTVEGGLARGCCPGGQRRVVPQGITRRRGRRRPRA